MEPKQGDIVIYVGGGENNEWAHRRQEKTEYMVVRVLPIQLWLVSIADPMEEIWIKPESAKVIRTATYSEVKSNPRKNADDAYEAFMAMPQSEWVGLIGSLIRGGVLEPEEQKGFDRALKERVLDRERSK